MNLLIPKNINDIVSQDEQECVCQFFIVRLVKKTCRFEYEYDISNMNKPFFKKCNCDHGCVE